VKQISILIAGFAAAFAIAPALAEDLTAGKTPAQLFRSDCGACHRSPNGLVRERGDVSGLADFLREHYTTKSDTAAALAAYVSGFAPSSASARNRGTAQPTRGRPRTRSEGDGPATAEDDPAAPRPADDSAGRRRHATGLSGDSDNRRARDDGDVPRPPRGVATTSGSTAASRSNAPTRVGQPHDDVISRLRSYLSSGLDSETASGQAAKTGAPKARKRRTGADDAPGAVRVNAREPAAARANADAPPAPPAAEPPRAPSEAAPGASLPGERQ
jgi:hypothetical protein